VGLMRHVKPVDRHLHSRFLIGDSLGAKADLEKSLDLVPSFVQSWVKIASVHMELGEWEPFSIGFSFYPDRSSFANVSGDAASAFGDFEAAIRHNADDPDIYYHRGQGESALLLPIAVWLR
jgi:import receptor subunit TOM70